MLQALEIDHCTHLAVFARPIQRIEAFQVVPRTPVVLRAACQPERARNFGDQFLDIRQAIYGEVSASIFAREHTLPGGKVITNYSVSLQRSYVDREGERQWTHNLDEDDLLPGAEALTDAYKVIQRLRRQK